MMRNKFKLKGEKIFIENNLSWEKRKIQEKINRQIKKQKEKSLEVKVGLARVRMKEVWRTWAEMEKEDQERVNRRKGKDILQKQWRKKERGEWESGNTEFCLNQEEGTVVKRGKDRGRGVVRGKVQGSEKKKFR